MTRAYLIAAMVAATLAAATWLYFTGRDHAQTEAENDALTETIENAEEFNDAADDASGGGWFDSLFPDATDN